MERRLDRLVIGAGDRAPAQRVDERCELVRIVEPRCIDLGRQSAVDAAAPTWLELPHNSQFMAQPVVLDRLQRDGVLQLLDGVVGAAATEPLLPNIRHRPICATDGHDLTYLRRVRNDMPALVMRWFPHECHRGRLYRYEVTKGEDARIHTCVFRSQHRTAQQRTRRRRRSCSAPTSGYGAAQAAP